MSATILEYAGELVVLRCWCGIQHAVPESLRKQQIRKHETGEVLGVYCPLGHSHVPAGESKAQKLERSLAYEISRHDQTKADLRNARQQVNAERAAKSRIRNRIKNGVCICCNRTFKNMAAHMETKHPEVVK